MTRRPCYHWGTLPVSRRPARARAARRTPTHHPDRHSRPGAATGRPHHPRRLVRIHPDRDAGGRPRGPRTRVRGPRRDRPRRDGRGARRPRPRARPRGRDQDAAPRPRRRRARVTAVPDRVARHREAPAPERAAGVRRRAVPGRAAVPRHEADPRRHPGGAARGSRRQQTRPAAPARHLRAHLPGGRVRARARHHPPRPEAVERDGRRVRRSDGHGLGDRQIRGQGTGDRGQQAGDRRQ